MLAEQLEQQFHVTMEQASAGQLYAAALALCRQRQQTLPTVEGERKLYYISAEFLVGKLLSCNLMNLGLWDQVEEELRRVGSSIAALEDAEPEPSLGNGGLGRLAACFMDSIATLGLPGDGVGLCYHYGLFRQVFDHNCQTEQPDGWIEPQSWLRDTGREYPVQFGARQVTGRLYEIDLPGYGNTSRSRLRLFDLVGVDPGLIREGITFDKTDVAHNLTLFLYPDDSDRAGRLLRVYQQYFMVSCAAQLILEELAERGFSREELDRHVVIQINDTHPSMIIPELVRRLTEEGMPFEQAADLVSRSCAYTNHTILAEALERWPAADLEEVVPQLMPVIRALDALAKRRHPEPEVAIIDENQQVQMARMDIHYGFSVNGVAALHTEILKNSELAPFYRIYPEKFTSKTNGITFRRWLMGCNPQLADFITRRIGPDWKRDAAALTRLAQWKTDCESLTELLRIKAAGKQALVRALAAAGETVDPDSIFDVQIKRLHEYKRQQMNLLYIIWKYRQIKAGKIPRRPVTFLFGAKAAPAYRIAKDIIHAILCMAAVIRQDPEASKWIRIVFVENYNVSWAERIVPAAEISEQISLASKEASGTGNMKLMLNGALTLGTLDGANLEIADLVGEENFYRFGRPSEEVIRLYADGGYRAQDLYQKPEIEPLVDFLLAKPMLRQGDAEQLGRLYQDLTHKDWFMALLDLEDYIRVKEQMLDDYEDRNGWASKMLINIAQAGYFSSDRTIAEYNRDIWRL
ncbi:MAG TPA: glycogen/starch/alpha-glucan family phosphorylase [Candidatus Pygmaiobacter gallistercoris]|nr:glycogen/starch/alpha-glucan family phosphorylase [Candidatus Pygmaiobacter gallistercoris]